MIGYVRSPGLLPSISDEKPAAVWQVQHVSNYPQRLLSLLSRLSRAFLYALVPQLIRTRYYRDLLPPTRLNSTSWMNGLRGLAAIMVVNLHYWYAWSHLTVRGFHQSIPGQRYWFQLPPFPLLWDGMAAVQIFWAVAGYTCSYKALEAMTKQDHTTLIKTFPGSVFRRFFRLYLLPGTSMLMISLLCYFGAFEPTRKYFLDEKTRAQNFPGPMGEMHPKRFPTLMGQLGEWKLEYLKMANFWIEFNGDPPLDIHLWTICYEFRASMNLFVALIGLALCKPHVRIFWLAFIGYLHAFQWPHFECLPFFYGAIIAQLNILRKKEKCSVQLHLRLRTLMRACGFALTVYLLCFPIKGYRHPAPLYGWIKDWIPATYGRPNGPKFPKQIGSLLLIYMLDTVPVEDRARSRLHRLLTCNVAMYLGSIMFAIYLMHGCVMHLFGFALPHLIWERIGKETSTNYLFGLWAGYFVTVLAVLWAADVWNREVEGRMNKLIKRLEMFCFEPSK